MALNDSRDSEIEHQRVHSIRNLRFVKEGLKDRTCEVHSMRSL